MASLHLSPFQLIPQQCSILFLNLHGCLCCDKPLGCSTLLLPQQGTFWFSPFLCQTADSQNHRSLFSG